MDVILIPGLWLRGGSWYAVTDRLRAAGHTVKEVPMPEAPGASAEETAPASLESWRDAVVQAVDNALDGVAVVGHSAAATLALLAADARPEKVRRVVYLGGFPRADGETLLAELAGQSDSVDFPGWEAFEHAEVRDLGDDARTYLQRRMAPVPAAVLTGVVRFADERRADVPATVICPEFSAAEGRRWLSEGRLPELSRAEDITWVDLDSGHWPQISAPRELAELLSDPGTAWSV